MADGDDMVIGSWYNYATAPTFLSAKFSPVLWIDGSAKGAETGIYGQGSTIGIHGDAGDIGVKGESVKVGVRGTARTGAAEEILSAGNGVEGLSGSGIGVKGTSNSGAGVFGKGRPGVQGNGTSDGIGVVGIAGSNKGTGVEGQADGGTGVSGTVITGTGVFGRAPKGIALWGQSATKQGVLGQSSSSTGVEGTSVSGIGVKAEANGVFPAVVASAPNAIAVNGDGVYGVRGASTTKSGIGVFGNARTVMPATLKATSWSMGTSRRRALGVPSRYDFRIGHIGNFTRLRVPKAGLRISERGDWSRAKLR